MDDEEGMYDDLVCITCNDNLAPPIYYCGRIKDHLMCEKCIFQQIKCIFCGSIDWKRSVEAEKHFDPHEMKQCFLCGFSGDAIAIVQHDSECPFIQTVRCPLEDPYCPFTNVYTGKEIDHVINEHVNPISPLDEINNPEVVEEGSFSFSNDHKPDPGDLFQIDEFSPMDIDYNSSAFPGFAPPHDISDISPYTDAIRLAMVENTPNFIMRCKNINFPGFFRHNVLWKFTRDSATIGFICALQHYEKCLGLDKFRIAVIFLGKYKSETKYSVDVTFACGDFIKQERIRALNILENMHKLPPYESVMEIKNKEFNPDYSHSSCHIVFQLIENQVPNLSKLSFEPESVIQLT